MISETEEMHSFLIADYEFMQKEIELQFNHFMGVFYFWVAVVGIPVTGSVLSTLGLENADGLERRLALGLLWLFISCLGLFLSAKMFDIRRSQLRYIAQANGIRLYFWNKHQIEEKNGLKPLGKDVDLLKTVRSDFGYQMAWVMGLINGIVTAIGLYIVLTVISNMAILSLLVGVGGGVVMMACTKKLYDRLVVEGVRAMVSKSAALPSDVAPKPGTPPHAGAAPTVQATP
jgi:hypothetical protein